MVPLFQIRNYLGSVYTLYSWFSVCFYQQAARNLKNTESLKACHRCGSPAKYDPYLQRATCNRESCGFDFCTKCLCSYHRSSDCVSSRPVKHNSAPGPLPGTKKSKQNLKRLWSFPPIQIGKCPIKASLFIHEENAFCIHKNG